MAILWQNTFDGPDGEPVTLANSGDHGSPVDIVQGDVTYSTQWRAGGSASVRIVGDADASVGFGVRVGESLGLPLWSGRAYFYVPPGGSLVCACNSGGPGASQLQPFRIRDDIGEYRLLGQERAELPGALVGRTVRVEWQRTTRSGPTALRAWWTNPHAVDDPDVDMIGPDVVNSVTEMQFLLSPGWGGEGYVDEVMATDQAEWIGPTINRSEDGPGFIRFGLSIVADGGVTGDTPGTVNLGLGIEADGSASGATPGEVPLGLAVVADGTAGSVDATGAPVRDMWLGPLGGLHRMRRRATWERAPALGAETHTSLRGRVVATRALWAPRTTSLSWDRLDRDDAETLEEMVLTPGMVDATVQVIDPDARNLLTVEQSRGRPARAAGAGDATGVQELYRADGSGEMSTATPGGRPRAVLVGGAVGTRVSWLHPYWGVRGWPVMPGWPAYLHAPLDPVGGTAPVPAHGRLWLTFYDVSGAVISSAAGGEGTGHVEADAPEGAASVQPSIVLTSAPHTATPVGPAWLSYRPIPAGDAVPLGNGCPTYAVTSFSDEPHLPWRSMALELQEVAASAHR